MSAIVPRSAGDELGWFAPEIFGTEDYDLWVRILERGYRAVLNPDRLAVYRVTSGSVSSNAARQRENSQMVYSRALSRGMLNPAETRIARNQLRYAEAMEAVALIVDDRKWRQAVMKLPTIAYVVITRPSAWARWARFLLGGHR